MKHMWLKIALVVGIVWLTPNVLLAEEDQVKDKNEVEVTSESKRRGIQTGVWEVKEMFRNNSKKRQSVWNFRVVDDGSTLIIGLGERIETDGKKHQYGGGEAVIIIDAADDGALAGAYLESDNYGNQAEYAMDVSILESSDGEKQLYMATLDSNENIMSTFLGRWIKKEGVRKELKSGSWKLREMVGPDNGQYNIQWNYQLNEHKGKIYGKGNKEIVNGRKAHPNEAKTVCNIFLERQAGNLDSLKGTGTEKIPYGKPYYAAYDGWVSPSGKRLVMLSYENNILAAIIVGSFVN